MIVHFLARPCEWGPSSDFIPSSAYCVFELANGARRIATVDNEQLQEAWRLRDRVCHIYIETDTTRLLRIEAATDEQKKVLRHVAVGSAWETLKGWATTILGLWAIILMGACVTPPYAEYGVMRTMAHARRLVACHAAEEEMGVTNQLCNIPVSFVDGYVGSKIAAACYVRAEHAVYIRTKYQAIRYLPWLLAHEYTHAIVWDPRHVIPKNWNIAGSPHLRMCNAIANAWGVPPELACPEGLK